MAHAARLLGSEEDELAAEGAVALCAPRPRERISWRLIAGIALGVVALLCVAGMAVPRRCCGAPLLASPLPSVSEVKAAMVGLSVCATVVQTAFATHDRLSVKPCAPFVPANFHSEHTIDVTGATAQHRIEGFGGAFTESSALVFQSLPRHLRRRFIEAYFSEDEGIGCAAHRRARGPERRPRRHRARLTRAARGARARFAWARQVHARARAHQQLRLFDQLVFLRRRARGF